MDRILFKCRCIATDKVGEQIRPSLAWVFAYRGEMRLTDRSIEWGSHRIDYADIDDAILVRVITPFGEPYNLIIRSAGRIWQFQLPSNSAFSFAPFACDPWWTICGLPIVPFVLDPFWTSGQPPFALKYTNYTYNIRKFMKCTVIIMLIIILCIVTLLNVV